MLRGLASLLCVLTTAWAVERPVSGGGSSGARAAAGPAEVRTTSPVGRYPRPLPFYYDLYTFRGRAGRTTVVASFSVPVEQLERETIHDGVRYRFDVTLVLADTALRSVSRTDDSVFVASPHALASEHLLHTYVEVQAAPSADALERVIMSDATTPGIGQLYSAPFPIPDYSGTRLMLSDIVLGRPDSTAGWRRGGVTLSLLPTSRLPTSSFDVYYEVYNLPAGDHYDTEMSVERVDDAGATVEDGGVVRTLFSGESRPGPDQALHELRSVGTSLAPGSYRLTITVTDKNRGETAHRSRLFQVRTWGPDATLVPALPWRQHARSQG